MSYEESKNKAWPQYLTAVTVALGMVSAGTVLGWTSPSMTLLLGENSPVPTMSYSDFGWIASTSAAGTALSPIVAACLVDRIGRKPILIASGILYIASWSFLIPATSVVWLYIARILSGTASGISLYVTPMYTAEISEPQRRGAIGVFKTLSLGFGILFESIIGPKVSFKTLNAVSMIFPILFLVTFIWMPESPYFYASRNMTDKSYASLMWLRGQKERCVMEKEMDTIDNFLKTNKKLNFIQTIKAISSKKNRRGFLLISVVSCGMAFSGIQVVASYTERIFEQINSPVNPPDAVIILNGFTTISIMGTIFLIDRIGRKIILLFSTISTACCCILIGTYMLLTQINILGNDYSWVAISGIFGYMLFITMGVTSIPMVLVSEIFPNETRTWSMCIISIFGSIIGFVVMKFFQVTDETVGAYVSFYIFGCSLSLVAIFCIFFMPETKNKSFNEIQELLQGQHKSEIKNGK